MSRRRRRRTSPRSSPPSSSISSAAAPTEQPDENAIIIRYAATDEDVVAIHQFLLVVAKPALMCPVNGTKSLLEIIRVTKEEAALMAIQNGRLIGTLGLMRPVWWYGDESFLTDRWHFVLPVHRHGDADRLLLAEACQIAAVAGLRFINQGKIRPQKNGNFILFPRLYDPKSATPNHPGSA